MTCDEIKRALLVMLDDVECKEIAPDHLVVCSPFVGIDGDYPEVHIVQAGNGNLTLTDFGESFRALTNINIDAMEGTTRPQIVLRIEALLGVKEERGRFNLEVAPNELGSGLHRMFEALSFVSDMVFTSKPRDEADFKDRVGSVLRSLKVVDGKLDLDRNVKLEAPSGREYRVDFRLKNVRDVWIESISAVTASSFTAQVDRANTMWGEYKVKQEDIDKGVRKPEFRCITLLDDTSPGMQQFAVPILSAVSNVELWSNLDRFKQRATELTAYAS